MSSFGAMMAEPIPSAAIPPTMLPVDMNIANSPKA